MVKTVTLYLPVNQAELEIFPADGVAAEPVAVAVPGWQQSAPLDAGL